MYSLQAAKRTLDAPECSSRIKRRSDGPFDSPCRGQQVFLLERMHERQRSATLFRVFYGSNQIGKNAIRFVHSSGSVAAQIRISESAASLTARLCGTTMRPGLVFERVNFPNSVGIVPGRA